MLIKYWLFIILTAGIMLSTFTGFAQHNALWQKADSLKYSNPEEAIKIGDYQLKHLEDTDDQIRARLLITRANIIKGTYNAAIEQVFTLKNITRFNEKNRIGIALAQSDLFRILFLDDQAQKHLDKARNLLKQSEEQQPLLNFLIQLHQVELALQRQQLEKARRILNQLQKIFPSSNTRIQAHHPLFLMRKGRLLTTQPQISAALNLYKNALAEMQQTRPYDAYHQAIAYNKTGELLIAQKRNKQAEAVLLKGLKKARQVKNQQLLQHLYEDLAHVTLALNKTEAHQRYKKKLLVLNPEIKNSNQESINRLYSLINENQKSQIATAKKNYSHARFIIWMGFSGLVLICLFLWGQSYWRRRYYKEMLNYLRANRKADVKIASANRPEKEDRSLRIPEAREKALLAKLKRFEKSTKFTSNDMSLAVLAGKLDTNTKYLSSIIKKHYHTNFNTFINKLRVQFIIEKLKTDPNYSNYKISYLAKVSGFSSHSNFSTVFKAIVGVSPGKFIDLLKKDQQTPKENREV